MYYPAVISSNIRWLFKEELKKFDEEPEAVLTAIKTDDPRIIIMRGYYTEGRVTELVYYIFDTKEDAEIAFQDLKDWPVQHDKSDE
jgi:hypothetical protein